MLREFFTWWGRQLWETLPERWRQSRRHDAIDGVMLTLEPSRAGALPMLDARRRRGTRDVALGRFGLDPAGLDQLRVSVGAVRAGALRLLLPPRMLLEKEVTLPLAAESGLETALRWEMDRLTPFPAEAVFWDWVLEARDRTRAQLKLRLRLVPKIAVASVLELLASAGLQPGLLASSAEPSRTIPLDGRHTPSGRSRAVAALAGLCALLLATAVAVPLVRQELAFRAVEARIEAVRPQVALADGIRKRLADRAANIDVMAAEAGRVGDALQMIATITQILPDDTYLFGLTLRDRMLTIIGQSAAAAKLIPALAADPAIRDPVFAAPVTRNEINGTEAFTIRAEMK